MKPIPSLKTIRAKLFSLFFLSIVALVLIGFMLNTFFLESFYIFKNESFFNSMEEDIAQAYEFDDKQIEPYIEKLGKFNEINIDITDEKGVILFSSVAKGQSGDNLPSEIDELFQASRKFALKGYIYETVVNEKHEDDRVRLVYMKGLTKNRHLIMTKPLKGIRESVAITNQFTLITGGIIILVGGIMTYIISVKATKPILEMSMTAERISNLDFDAHVNVKTEDEIGMLGTSINQISDKLSRSIDDLKQDIERRKRLVRDISHELKTPIGVIKGYSEGIKYGVADTAEMTDQYMNTIIDECNRMDDMVKEMIELSSYEYAEKKLNVSDIHAVSLVSALTERFEPIFKEKEIGFEAGGDLETVFKGDFKLVTRAVSNYLTNAIKHVDSEKTIELFIREDNEKVIMSVFNTGKQIPEAEIFKIWDVFYKIDETRARSPKSGSGLGLSISKQVAELHGGRVSVENLNKGVKFILEIPKDFT